MRRLLDPSIAPPEDANGYPFRWTCAETGFVVHARDYNTWVLKAKEHLKANGVPVMSNLEAVMQDQLCSTLPPDRCLYETGDQPPVNININFNSVVNWIKAVAMKVAGSEPYVDQAEADRRAQICVSCPLNVNLESGCGGGCQKLVEWLTPGMASRRTQYDLKLRSCAACTCFNKVAVWFPLAILEQTEEPDTQSKLPSFCWKRR